MRSNARVAMLVLPWLGCAPVPTWDPSLRGEVVEVDSGTPVVGALVVAVYENVAGA